MFTWPWKRKEIEKHETVQLGGRQVRVDQFDVVIPEDRVSYCENPEWEAYLCRGHSPYSRLDDIFELNSQAYFPSVYIREDRDEAFAEAYDARAVLRGDTRRAWRCDMRKG